MASNNNSSATQPLIPVFKGEKYHLWSLKMKTLFKSQELWELVENGYTEPTPAPAQPDQPLRDTRKKDAKALLYIQSALDDEIFPHIAATSTSTEAWEILKQEYMGDKKVINVKLQSLCREFETLVMKEKESVQVFLSRVSGLVSHMKTYGENVSEETIVSKVLRSLTKEFNHVVVAIEESKDLSTYTFDELMSSLIAHEERLNRGSEKGDEKAFQVRGNSFKGRPEKSGGSSGGRGQGRGTFRGRGRGRGRGNFADQRYQKSNLQCRYCNRSGHVEADCWTKQKDENKANFTEKVEEEGRLFMTMSTTTNVSDHVWYRQWMLE